MSFFGSGRQRNRNDLKYIDLNQTALEELRYFLQSNSVAKHCLYTLERFIVRSMRVQNASAHFEDYVQRFCIPFFKNILEHIILIGWCPYTYAKMKVRHRLDKGRYENVQVPVILPLDHAKFKLEVNTKKHTFQMKSFSLENGDELKYVKFVFLHDISKYANRYLMNSPLLGLLPQFRYLESIKRFTIQAEFVRSNPSIYLESMDEKPGEANIGMNAMQGGGLNPQQALNAANNANQNANRRLPSRLDALSGASKDMVKNVEFHNMQMEDFMVNQNANYYNLGLNYLPQHAHSLYICPPGMKLAAKPDLPQSRVDQTLLDRNLASDIFLACGVPEAMFGAKSGTFMKKYSNVTQGAGDKTKFNENGSNIMQINAFEATLEQYRDIFTRTFVHIYYDIFGSTISFEKVKFDPPNIYKQFLESIMFQFNIERAMLEAGNKDLRKSDTHHKEHALDAARKNTSLTRRTEIEGSNEDDDDDDDDDDNDNKKTKAMNLKDPRNPKRRKTSK